MLERHIESFNLRGYTIIEEVFSESVLNALSSEYNRLLKNFEDTFDPKTRNENEMGTIRLFLSRGLKPLIYNKLTDQILTELMGSYNFYSFSGIYTSPAFVHPTTLFHRDSKILSSSHVASVNLMYAIDEMVPENGATWVVPCSHTFSQKPSDDYIEENKVQLNVPKGGLVIFNSLLYHAAGVNKTNLPRRGVAIVVKQPIFKPAFDYREALSDELIESLSKKEMELLGFTSMPRNSVEEYYAEGVRRREFRKQMGIKTVRGIEVTGQ